MAENYSSANFDHFTFSLFSVRLFVCLFLSATISKSISEPLLAFVAECISKEFPIDENSDLFSFEYFSYLFFLAVCFALLPIMMFGIFLVSALLRVFNAEDVDLSNFIGGIRNLTFMCMYFIYECSLTTLAVFASLRVVLMQDSVINALFNFLGVLVILELDNIFASLVAIKLTTEMFKSNKFHINSARLAITAAVFVVSLLRCFASSSADKKEN
jgi:hypothetical protein